MQIQPLPFKPPRLLGFSELAICHHYQDVYGAAVRQLQVSDGLQQSTCEQIQAANSAALHEVFFDGLGGADGLGSMTQPPTGVIADQLTTDFGGYEQFLEQFAGQALALAPAPGWVVLNWSPLLQQLVITTQSDNAPALVDSMAVLALDLHPHAYRDDFGPDVQRYVNTWRQNLHWDRPAARLINAQNLSRNGNAPNSDSSDNTKRANDTSISVETLQHWLAQKNESGPKPYLLDVCLSDDQTRRHDMLPGADFRLSESLADWSSLMPTDRPIVVYCMYGFQVSDNAATELRQLGLDARRLRGGIASWRAIGAPTQAMQS